MSLNKAKLDKVINGTPAERTYLCSNDFSLFFCYYFTEYIKYPFAPFHYQMFEDIKNMMDDKYREVAWIMFRESAKTSFAKIFLVWLVVYNKRRYINVDSFSVTNAERILFDIVLALQTNPKIRHDFGEVFNSKRDTDEVSQKRVNNFVANNGVRVEAHSTGKSVRGRLHGNQRPDFLLLDDFETNDTKDSKAHTQAVISHIDEFKSGLDSQAKVMYLGNLITEYGSVQTLIDRAKTDSKLLVRNVPVEADGVPTWPAKYALTDEEATGTLKVSLEDKKRQLGSLVYSTEMLNQPISSEAQKFKKGMFKYKTKAQVMDMNTRKFATIDTALSKEAHSDKTGVVRNYVNTENFWHVSGKNYTVSPKGLIDLLFQLHDEGMEKIGIETTVYTQAIEPFFQDECRKRGKYPYVVQLKHGGVMKESRIESLVAPYEAGSIFHIEGECDEMEEQFLKFPVGLHDDIIDACFVAGTKILTISGQKNIEEVEVGELVMTRDGYKSVLHSWCSGEKEVITNIGLIGTKNHPVITKTGILDLQYVTESNTIYTWNEKLSCIEESNITGTQNQRENSTAPTIGLTQRIINVLSHFTDRYGSIASEKFHPGIIFITRIQTLLTTRCLTLNVFLQQSMRRFIPILKNLEKGHQSEQRATMNSYRGLLKNGGQRKKGLNGIPTMLKIRLINPLRLFARSVVKKTLNVLRMQNSVQPYAKGRISLENGDPGILITTKRKVYNLEVEDCHEYFANSVLVHNCQYQRFIAEAPYHRQETEFIEEKPIFSDIGL